MERMNLCSPEKAKGASSDVMKAKRNIWRENNLDERKQISSSDQN
jgi:hypothetical protein